MALGLMLCLVTQCVNAQNDSSQVNGQNAGTKGSVRYSASIHRPSCGLRYSGAIDRMPQDSQVLFFVVLGGVKQFRGSQQRGEERMALPFRQRGKSRQHVFGQQGRCDSQCL
ncbi:hypothetical protein D9M70_432500 [compost metagenome]